MFKRLTGSRREVSDYEEDRGRDTRDRAKSRAQVRQQTKDFLPQLIDFNQDFRVKYPLDLHPKIDEALSDLKAAVHNLYYGLQIGKSRSGRGESIGDVIEMVSAINGRLLGTQDAELQSRSQSILDLWTILRGDLEAYCGHMKIKLPYGNRDTKTPPLCDPTTGPQSQRGSPPATVTHTSDCSLDRQSESRLTGGEIQLSPAHYGELPRPPWSYAESVGEPDDGSYHGPRQPGGVSDWTPV
jgi:hypothetical protein